MKIKFLFIALMLGFASLTNAQTWSNYKDKSAKFSISLPATPVVTEESDMRLVKADYGDYTNIIKVFYLPNGIKGDQYSQAAEMIMAGMAEEAKLVRKSDLTINGQKGLRASFYLPSQKFCVDKGVVIDGKFAYVITQMRSNQDDTAIADKIFNSINR